MSAAGFGPGLAEVLAAQRADEDIVAYPQLEKYATALADLCQVLNGPSLWPVGTAAERLAGAAAVVGRGRVHFWGQGDDHFHQQVLLVTVSAVTPLALLFAADQARRLGATEVMACGVNVNGIGLYGSHRLSYVQLDPAPTIKASALAL